MMRVKTNIQEMKKTNLISQYWEGKCPSCREKVKVFSPPDFTDWKSAYKEIEDRYNALKEYTFEYSLFLEKQIGYYPEDIYLQECLSEMISQLTKLHPFINFDKFKDKKDKKDEER